jgi:predicted dehydrogenase
MDRAKLAVVGAGLWGQNHIKAYQDHRGVELAALCDMNESRLNEVADLYDIPNRFTDYRELMAMDGLDGVSIATPDFSHADIAVEAIDNGRHVIVEKPLATTMEDCDRIGEALADNPVKFMVDFHNRWNPAMQEFKNRIDSGEVGHAEMIYYRLSDRISVPTDMLSWAGKSTVAWFLASHCLDTMLWMLDDEVTRVYTKTSSKVLKERGVDTPDYYQTMVEFGSGTSMMMENCWILAGSSPNLVDFKLEVVGEKGTLYFGTTPSNTRVYTEESVDHPLLAVGSPVFGVPRGFGINSIKHFADCVCDDEEPLSGFEDGREVTRIILAMEESAEKGMPVDLD